MEDQNGYSGLNELGNPVQREKEPMIKLARPIPNKAEIAHQEVLQKINRVIPKPSIERKVMCNQMNGSIGGLIKLEDGKMHVLVSKEIADFDHTFEDYNLFAKLNRRASPKDFFKHVVSHEYGHLIFDERVERRLVEYDAPFELSIPKSEPSEAFAFWFSDQITGFKSPLDRYAPNYIARGYKFDLVVRGYVGLNRLKRNEGIQAVFDWDRLAEIFEMD